VDTLSSIKVFRQVVESGSFIAAAERVDLSTAMVSKHVMHIEKRLGVRLLNRNSRTLSLTEPGRLYYERCRTILDDLEATELELGTLNTVPRGTLRITAPSWIGGSRRFAMAVAEFRQRYPEIIVDASFEDRIVDLVDEGYDLALRVARGPDSLAAGLVARPLTPATFYLAASHEYIKRKGVPKTLEDIARHEFVAIGNLNALHLTSPAGVVEVPIPVVLRYRSMSGVANAVAAGIGIAPLPAIYFEDPALKDRLTPVLSEYPMREATVYIAYVSRKYLPLKIRTFIDFCVEWVSTHAPPEPPAAR
jgi:DNA-binding transcriptional LysR family regulator